MRTTLIRTVPRCTINALAYQGILPCEHHAQLHDTLLRHLGERHARIFAEPVVNAVEGFIDWYVPFTGEVRPYSTLGPEEQETLTQELAHLASEIRDYANALIASGEAQKITRGNILLLALRYPGDDDLFLVDATPVVTCWGFAQGTPGAQLANLCDVRVRAQKPPVPTAAAVNVPLANASEPEKRVFWALPWLVPLVLGLLLFLLLFADFGEQKAVSGISLVHLPSLRAEEYARERAILDELAAQEAERKALEAQALAHIARCRTTTAQTPKQALVIPKNVRDTRFLEGRWLCETGLVNARTGEPVKVEFAFDAKGQGHGRVYEVNDICTGEARARYAKGVLHIEHDPLRCAHKDGAYNPNVIECRNTPAGTTECLGKNTDGEPWNALFLRLSDTTRP